MSPGSFSHSEAYTKPPPPSSITRERPPPRGDRAGGFRASGLILCMIIGMALNNQHRRAYRQGLPPRQSRFDEMMASVINASARCSVCRLHHPANLVEEGVCSACRRTLKRQSTRIQKATPLSPPELAYDQPVEIADNVVFVDASWRDGTAGLAVVGAVGAHSKRIQCSSSNSAECEALRWAFSIARPLGRKDLIFRTDSQRAATTQAPSKTGWAIEWVPRHKNARADRAATVARLARR